MEHIEIGDILTNNDIIRIFQVANMGGMRRSINTNSLVLISDHTKGLYDDKWQGDTLHYTGMGKKGDQALASQNKTLNESNTNGINIHLFEVLKPKEYIYCGIVTLTGDPYIEKQKDEDGVLRNVWIFPLKVKDKNFIINESTLIEYKKKATKQALKLQEDELKTKAAERSTNKPSNRTIQSTTYIRDEYIAEYAKRRACGICQLCGSPAPFNLPDGQPYLECHHIEWLSKGGADSIENTIALCPNCHRKMHLVNSPRDIAILKAKYNT